MLKIEKEPENPDKLRLNLNGMDILEWFRKKYRELQEKVEIKFKPKQSKMRIY
jgi:hypothetical protein